MRSPSINKVTHDKNSLFSRGIVSEAMVMCASTPDKVEILAPPPGCKPGDKVMVEGFTCNPDPVLNPKKKVNYY